VYVRQVGRCAHPHLHSGDTDLEDTLVVPAAMSTHDGRTLLVRAGLQETPSLPNGDCCPTSLDHTGRFGIGQQGVRDASAAWLRGGGLAQRQVFDMWNQDHYFDSLAHCARYTQQSGNWFKAVQIHAAAHAMQRDIVVLCKDSVGSTDDEHLLTCYSQKGTSKLMYIADYVYNPQHLVILWENDCHFSGTEQTVPAHDTQHYCCYACSCDACMSRLSVSTSLSLPILLGVGGV
jgi:hypothetical protein